MEAIRKWIGDLLTWVVGLSKWSHLRAFAESRFVRSSAIWVVVVPIGAKIVLALQEHVTSPEWAARAVASLSLPFSWRLLFVASLLCLVANKVYDWRCPSIVKDQRDLGEFLASGRRPMHLVRYLCEVATERIPGTMTLPPRRIIGDLVADDRSVSRLKARSGDVVTTTSFGTYEDAFWPLREHADWSRKFARAAVSALYTVGLALFFAVFCQNLWWVAKAIFA